MVEVIWTKLATNQLEGAVKYIQEELGTFYANLLMNKIIDQVGHLKTDHRLSRNYYKEIFGDNINVMLAAAAMNFKRMMNKWKKNPLAFIFLYLKFLTDQLFLSKSLSKNRFMTF